MSNEGPARILYDEAGNRVGVSTNPFQVTGYVNVDRVGVTGPVRVDAVGVTGPVGVTGAISVVGAVGVTGPVRVDSVGLTGYVQVTGPVGVTGQVAVVGAVGVTGPVRVDSVGGTGPFRVDSVGGTGPFRVDSVGITGLVQATGPIGVTGLVQVVGAVGVTGPVRVDSVGVTGYAQVTGPIGVTGLVSVVGAVGGTGPFRVDSVGGTGPFRVDSVGGTGPFRVDQVGGTGPFRVDSVGVTGPVFVAGFGSAGTPTGGLLSVQGVSGAQPQPVVGGAPVGLPASGNPILAAGLGSTGTVQVPAVLNAQPTGAEYGMVARSIPKTSATFWAIFDRIVPAANKYMATLWNGASGRKVIIHRIWRFNWQVATVTGVSLDQEVRRITARTAGTTVTPVSLDTADPLTSGIVADHLSTSVTDSSLLMRIAAASEERDIQDMRLSDQLAVTPAAIVYESHPATRGIVLRQNEGLTIKNITSSTVGTVSYILEFTDEVA